MVGWTSWAAVFCSVASVRYFHGRVANAAEGRDGVVLQRTIEERHVDERLAGPRRPIVAEGGDHRAPEEVVASQNQGQHGLARHRLVAVSDDCPRQGRPQKLRPFLVQRRDEGWKDGDGIGHEPPIRHCPQPVVSDR